MGQVNVARINTSILLKYAERAELDPYSVSGTVSLALLENCSPPRRSSAGPERHGRYPAAAGGHPACSAPSNGVVQIRRHHLHPTYYRWMDAASWHLFARGWLHPPRMRAEHLSLPLGAHRMRFVRSPTFGERCIVESCVERLGQVVHGAAPAFSTRTASRNWPAAAGRGSGVVTRRGRARLCGGEALPARCGAIWRAGNEPPRLPLRLAVSCQRQAQALRAVLMCRHIRTRHSARGPQPAGAAQAPADQGIVVPASALALVMLAGLIHAGAGTSPPRRPAATRDLDHLHQRGHDHVLGAAGALAQVAQVPRWDFSSGCSSSPARLHLVYYLVLLRGYRPDLTVVYPLARGSGPFCCRRWWRDRRAGERINALGAAGIAGVVGGCSWWRAVLACCGPTTESARRERVLIGMRCGLLTGVFIAAYTVVDGYAVKVLLMSPILLDYGWCGAHRFPGPGRVARPRGRSSVVAPVNGSTRCWSASSVRCPTCCTVRCRWRRCRTWPGARGPMLFAALSVAICWARRLACRSSPTRR